MKEAAARVAVLLAAFAVVYLPYRISGDPVIAGDYTHHFVSIGGFRDALHEGEWYPRWSASVNRGLGAATFYFYPPLPYYFASACADLVGDLAHGLRLAAALAAALGAWAVFGLVRTGSAPRGRAWPAALAAILYAALPYALFAAFHRFAWAEYCGMQCVPWLAWSVRDLIARPTRGSTARTVLSATAIAGCHLLTSLVVAPGIVLWFAGAAIRRRSIAIVGRGAIAGVLAFLLAGGFLIPVIADVDEIHLDHAQRTETCRYQTNFLFHDEVAAGFLRAQSKSTMEWIVILEAATLLLAFAVLRRARRNDGDLARLAAGLVLAVGATWLAEPIWRTIPGLSILQFPARLIAPLGLLVAWSVGLAFAHATRVGRCIVTVPAILCAVGGAMIVFDAYPADRPAAPQSRSTDFILREYTPSQLDHDLLIDAWRAHGARAHVTRGAATVERMTRTTHRTEWRVRVDGQDPASIILPLFAYPGWEIRIDGALAAPHPPDALGLLNCNIPPGEHTLVAEHRAAPSRRAGLWLSAFGVVLTAGWLVRRRRPTEVTGERVTGSVPGWLAALIALGGISALVWLRTTAPATAAPTDVVLITTSGEVPRYLDTWLSFPRTRGSSAADFARNTLEESALLQHARDAGARIGVFVDATAPERLDAKSMLRDLETSRAPTAEVTRAARAWIRTDAAPIVAWIHLGDASADRIQELMQTLRVSYRFADATIAIRGPSGSTLVKPPGEPLGESVITTGVLDGARLGTAVADRLAGRGRSPRSFANRLLGSPLPLPR